MKGLQVFTLPGLGFDHRIFSKVDFGGLPVQHLDWLEPIGEEPLPGYARRMAEQMKNKDGRIVFVGHSFGGIVAQEMAQFVDIEAIVLISSIKSANENPLHFRMIAPLRLQRFFTKRLTFATFNWWARAAGYCFQEERTLFRSMVGQQSDHLLQWSLKNLSRWQTPAPLTARIVRIHGSADRNFPVRLIRPPFYEVKNGGHFMVYNNAAEVGQALRRALI